ncbi:bromodomain-containing protein [Nostoc sp. PA-18-2419]|uniref:bromodomain-containing protein n=1 Tax=Nostoc sp. PA-18-2419 TaxID=2575443 RepID=UPI001108B4A0|nr:bromodomain-containing protein [Nostoc sp. PA-18-2419]
MDWKYKWKNGYRPSRDEAAKNPHLLDESQFDNEQDRKLAEEATRKHLGVPAPTLDEDKSILPQ